MNTRIATIKARIAYLRKALAEEMKKDGGCDPKEADGASVIRGAEKLPPAPKIDVEAACKDGECKEVACTAEEEDRKAIKAALRRAAHRRALRKAAEAGIEDKISQKYLRDVEGITHTPAGVDPSIRTKLRHASVSLDRIADQLEKDGKIALAYRVDRVADAIDARLAKLSK